MVVSIEPYILVPALAGRLPALVGGIKEIGAID